MRFFLKACQPKPMQSYYRNAGKIIDYRHHSLEPIKITKELFPLIPEDKKLLCIYNFIGKKGFAEVYICEDVYDIRNAMYNFGEEYIHFAIAPKECFLEEKIMNRAELLALMSSSKSVSEWGDNCDKVKALFGGDYPSFWISTIFPIDRRFLETPKQKSTHDTSNETNEDCQRKKMYSATHLLLFIVASSIVIGHVLPCTQPSTSSPAP